VAQIALPPNITAIINTALGSFGKISYAGWGSFGPGPEALAVGLAAPVVLRFAPVVPDIGFDPVVKAVVSNVLASVGYGDYEKGVYDTPEPSVYPVLPGPDEVIFHPGIPVSDETDLPVFLPSWPEEWKKKPGDEPGWVDDEWVYPEENVVGFVDILSGAIDIAQGQPVGGGSYDVNYDVARGDFAQPFPSVNTPPAKITVDTKTGKVTACRRRRRRRLLTPTDLNDLAALKTIVGGGQAINFAVMKAVRR
jgi:hypothetical protein